MAGEEFCDKADAIPGYRDPQMQGMSDLLPPGGLFLSQQACLLQVLCQTLSFLPVRLPST